MVLCGEIYLLSRGGSDADSSAASCALCVHDVPLKYLLRISIPSHCLYVMQSADHGSSEGESMVLLVSGWVRLHEASIYSANANLVGG